MDVFREISHQHARHACIMLSDPPKGNRRHPLVMPALARQRKATLRTDHLICSALPSGVGGIVRSCRAAVWAPSTATPSGVPPLQVLGYLYSMPD